MKYTFIGLGNPGKDYESTRHNTGRIVLESIAEKHGFFKWESDGELRALVTDGSVGEEEVRFVLPETFMNKSGFTAKKLASTAERAKNLVVVYDEIDLPIGSFKISFGRGDAGHNGIRSIINTLGTKDFIRIRVGVSPKVRGSNQPRKPKGEDKILNFLLGKFRKDEETIIVKLSKDIYSAMKVIVEEGLSKAMDEFNQKPWKEEE